MPVLQMNKLKVKEIKHPICSGSQFKYKLTQTPMLSPWDNPGFLAVSQDYKAYFIKSSYVIINLF